MTARRHLAAAWVGLGLMLGCGSAPEPVDAPTHVLLLTVDTLRADHVDTDGYREPTMPFVASLMARGATFSRAFAPVPRTTPALASLLTGQYPHRTGVRALSDRLRADAEPLAQMAQRAGYRTLAVVSNHVLAPARGLDRGFERYDFAGNLRSADQTTDAALERVGEIAAGERVFLWVHYIDPHVPYDPPPELAERFDPDYRGRYRHGFGSRSGADAPNPYPVDLPKREAVFANPLSAATNAHIRTLYAADIRATDGEIARLVAGLEAQHGDDWLVVVSADHGESLGEHDFFYDHGDYVYNASTRVPLVIARLGRAPFAGARIDVPVSLVDVAPTLMELLGLEPQGRREPRFEGRSLAPALRGEPLAQRPVFAESGRSYHPDLVRGRVHFDVAGRFRSVVDGDWKLIWTPGQTGPAEYQLYRWVEDPDELHDVAARHPERVAHLRGLLDAWTRDDPHAPEPELTPDAREALRRLGYVDE